MFDTVLVANRGEIAVRVVRTLKALGIRSAVVFSDADDGALHTRVADVALRIGPAAAAESYLNAGRVIDAARRAGAQAIHPGYGFLSENADFARACADAGLTWIGPPPAAIETMGDKVRAKQAVAAAAVPVVPWAPPEQADLVGYPLLVKAAAGGGGKGMRVVRERAGLADAVAAATREAAAAFGDGTVFCERLVERPRHIEIQVLADAHGTVVHLGERECSLQRRHQKVVEECPSPLLDDAARGALGAAAVAAARACDYVGAGTVEFIVPGGQPAAFFFLEMNTRLQVEHPVTELVYGIDLVEWQLRVAAGQRLALDCVPRGHAIEARVYAEDPERGFLPTGGRVLVLDEPAGGRVDTGIAEGAVVGSSYDPLLAKVVAHGPDRDRALRRLDALLAEYTLLGVTTNVGFLRRLLALPDVRAGELDTGLVERRLADLVDLEVPEDVYVAAALAHIRARAPTGPVVDPFDLPGGWRLGAPAATLVRLRAAAGDAVDVRLVGSGVAVDDGPTRPVSATLAGSRLRMELDGTVRCYHVVEDADVLWIGRDGRTWALREQERLGAARRRPDAPAAGQLVAPMPGTVTVVHVEVGQRVTAGQPVVVVEAMKMEHPVTAPSDGTVVRLDVKPGQQVRMQQVLAVVEPG